MPLTIVIIVGSLAEMFRLKLLSMPHSIQAASTPSAPKEIPHALPSQDSRMLATVMAPMAHQMRLPMASLKNIPAIMVVATPSKFRSSEAVDPGV